jgi:hypothetical protein
VTGIRTDDARLRVVAPPAIAPPGGEPAGEVAVVTAGYGVIGLLTRLLIDSLNKEKATVYVHGRGPRSTHLQVSLFGSKSMIGVQVSAGR